MIARRSLLAAAATAPLAATARAATPFKVGLILPMTGPSQSTGKQISAAVALYQKMHGDTAGGRKVEVILRDDGGVADVTKRLAQELIVRDKVGILAGFGLTPLAMATAPLVAQAKVPMLIMSAATSIIVKQNDFIVRCSQVVPQPAVGMAQWALKNGIRNSVTLVSDYGPGLDAETWYVKAFKAGGGEIGASLRVPLANPDFAPFLQRAADLKPQALFAFVPSGQGAALARQFGERGLDKSGIKFIGTGDVTDDDQLNGMGDVVLGMITCGPYSAAHPSAVNKEFVAAFEKANPGMRPNFMAVFGFDGMHVIHDALNRTKGDSDGAKLVEAMKGESFESPRGPFLIDPATRDVVHNMYIRKVERQNGQLYNIEFDTIPMMKDPAKA
jgi:branched-chain amino acid transport system substrate-binding protein